MIDIRLHRLHNQQLMQQQFATPAEVVAWLCAVQSQDYHGAKWALGQRLYGYDDSMLDQAFDQGTILRTHVMRPTWHFVTPEDIRWMLELTAPRVHALTAYYYRQLELDDAVFAKSVDILVKALEGGKQLTRKELTAALIAAGIQAEPPLRCTHIILYAELEGIVCSGARRGKQFTYALLDERAPQAKRLPREEALAELTRRYLTSHGPATAHDFSWWSGLTMADAKTGIEMVKLHFLHEEVDGQTYWFPPTMPTPPQPHESVAYLLPNFDEYTVAYKDRSALFDQWEIELEGPAEVMVMNNVVVIDGRAAGNWKRVIKKKEIDLEVTLFRSLNTAENQAFTAAVERFSAFMGLPVTLTPITAQTIRPSRAMLRSTYSE